MSKIFGALSVLLVLIGAWLFFGANVSDHSYTITLVEKGGKYEAEHKSLIEIDWAYTTTFTVENKTGVDLYFSLDAGPNGAMCRVTFTPNDATKCETPALLVSRTAPTTFTATAKDMRGRHYSYLPVPGLGAWPRFDADFKVSDDPTKPPKKIDPDLEVERDPPPPFVVGPIIAGILAGLAAWMTRRRS